MNSLYNDFQLKVINETISAHKNSSYIFSSNKKNKKNKNNKKNIDNVDESIVDDILSNKYMNIHSLNTICSMFNEIILYNNKIDQQKDEENKYITRVLNSFTFVSKNRASKFHTLLSNFKTIKELVVIKSACREDNDLNILYEYFIGSIGINKLRSIIPNFCYTLSIFRHNALRIVDTIPQKIDIFFSDNKEERKDTRFYVVYERIKGMSLADFIETIKTKEDMDNLISYLIQIVFAIKVAQDEIGFVHYDLHSDNILLRPLEEIVTVEYIINNKVYKIKTNAIPTIIGYEHSHFQYKDIQFGMINLENTGINSTKNPKGYDIYKLFHFVLMSVLIGNPDEEKFNDISWILEYYEYHYNSSPQKEDPYGIYRAFYDMTKGENWSELGDSNNIKLAFSKGKDNYFSLTESTPLLYNDDPMSFINWMEFKHPLKFKQFIESVSDVVHKQESPSIIAKKYYSKIELNRIFNIDVIDDIVDCDILNQKNNTFYNKSYIINKYITREFTTITDIFSKNIKDVDLVNEKVKEIDQQNEDNKAQYQENDISLFRAIKDELDIIYKKSDINECFYRLSTMRNTLDIKILNRKIEDFVTYNYTYESKYKKFIYYSMASNHLYIDKDLEQFYIQSKILCSQFSLKKSEHIFNWFRTTLDVILYFIYNNKENNYNNLANLPKIIDQSFEESLHSIQNLFNDIKYFYPTISYAYQEIEGLITNTILNIGLSHNTYIYLFTKSLFQIRQTYLCDNKRLTSLVVKSLRRDIDPQTIDTILKSSIDHRYTNDISIYNLLRPYANKGYDKEKRSKSRIKQLQFLFQHNLFKNIRSNRNFKYLDLGGWDGTITEEVGKYMRLSKKDIINADVDDWVNQIDENERNPNITFVPINNNGRLPFETATFSLITAFQVFHHIEEIDDRLSELSRIIKKDGLLVIREHDANSDCTSMLADIEHSMYEMVLKENTSSDYLNKYEAYYKPMQTWTNIIEYYGFEYIKNAKYNTRMNMWNPSRTYYAMYKKK
jgi:ubiquinone/menaquinone biosynthesis C-methylase UbiE